jgi:hypothetical protein
LREGDASTQFFHLQACHRGRQNRIDLLRHNDFVLVDETQKVDAIDKVWYHGCPVKELPQKLGICRIKIYQGILDEVRMHKHTYEAYKDMIKVEIMLLELCLRFTRH